jgi:hypothetical protein
LPRHDRRARISPHEERVPEDRPDVKGSRAGRSGQRLAIQLAKRTAHLLDEDDPQERIRILGRGNLARNLCLRASATVGTSLLTVRIDVDPH